LAGLYQSAVLSVYVSVFEGFGLPVIEAMAGGCPVVTSSVSCLPETAGDAAVLCNPGKIEEIGEKILSLLEDEKFRKETILKGLERAGQFHPGNYAKILVSLYTKILEEKDA
jgi:glycosyltransferase involved in cell wall biosynthesis